MTRYIAFLRGINVGGRKMIKMAELVRLFTAAGFKNVRTFIASGNIIFDSPQKDPKALAGKIEKTLLKGLGFEVAVVVMTLDKLKAITKRNPFKLVKPSDDVMLFVTLFSSELKPRPKLPLKNASDNLDVISVTDSAAFMIAHRKKTGWFEFPNNFIEKAFGVTATTRNWSTLVRIVTMAETVIYP
jgi:uncharacterized protein (DUF1697 family)